MDLDTPYNDELIGDSWRNAEDRCCPVCGNQLIRGHEPEIPLRGVSSDQRLQQPTGDVGFMGNLRR